ncbi:MAG: hypothetical protein V2I97_20865 [Desulfococcaceae bacterium]|jgi:antitoxin YefM|nr:hypothetical protein [Desulfococcaceae bacterium]
MTVSRSSSLTKNGEPIVMISLEDFGSVSKTAHLLISPKNAKWLMSAIDELESGYR